jgi:hypothetical protein
VVWVEDVGECDSAGALVRSRRVACSCLVFVLLRRFFLFFFVVVGTIPIPFIVSRRCRVIECGRVVRPLLEESRGLGRALSGGDVICTVEAWCRYFWYCCYVLGMGTTVEGVVSVFRRCSGASCHS